MAKLSYKIEDGFLRLEGKGSYLGQPEMPCAVLGSCVQRPLPLLPGSWREVLARLFMADRGRLRLWELSGSAWLARSGFPRLLVVPLGGGGKLSVCSGNLLACPLESRKGGGVLRPVPASGKASFCVTRLEGGWAALSAREAVTRIPLAEGEELFLRRSSALAWDGGDPCGHCGRLSVKELLLPRAPGSLALRFRGPGAVWVQGPEGEGRKPVRRGVTACF